MKNFFKIMLDGLLISAVGCCPYICFYLTYYMLHLIKDASGWVAVGYCAVAIFFFAVAIFVINILANVWKESKNANQS